MPDHEERPPTALAHGAVKSGDIERVRRDVDQSDARVAHNKKSAAASQGRARTRRRGVGRRLTARCAQPFKEAALRISRAGAAGVRRRCVEHKRQWREKARESAVAGLPGR